MFVFIDFHFTTHPYDTPFFSLIKDLQIIYAPRSFLPHGVSVLNSQGWLTLGPDPRASQSHEHIVSQKSAHRRALALSTGPRHIAGHHAISMPAPNICQLPILREHGKSRSNTGAIAVEDVNIRINDDIAMNMWAAMAFSREGGGLRKPVQVSGARIIDDM